MPRAGRPARRAPRRGGAGRAGPQRRPRRARRREPPPRAPRPRCRARAAMPTRHVRAGARSRRDGRAEQRGEPIEGGEPREGDEQHGQRRDRADGAEPGEEPVEGGGQPAGGAEPVHADRVVGAHGGLDVRHGGTQRGGAPRASSPRDRRARSTARRSRPAGRRTRRRRPGRAQRRRRPRPSRRPARRTTPPRPGSSGCQVPTTRSRRGPSPSCSSTRSPTARPSVAAAAACRAAGVAASSAAATSPPRRRATIRSELRPAGHAVVGEQHGCERRAVVDGVDRCGLHRPAPVHAVRHEHPVEHGCRGLGLRLGIARDADLPSRGAVGAGRRHEAVAEARRRGASEGVDDARAETGQEEHDGGDRAQHARARSGARERDPCRSHAVSS